MGSTEVLVLVLCMVLESMEKLLHQHRAMEVAEAVVEVVVEVDTKRRSYFDNHSKEMNEFSQIHSSFSLQRTDCSDSDDEIL